MTLNINENIREASQKSFSQISSQTENFEEDNKSSLNHYVVTSAISAGLGALTFRNHYRALKEQAEGSKKSKWKTAGKLASGLGVAGAAGLGTYKLASGDKIETGTNTLVTNTGNESDRLLSGKRGTTGGNIKNTVMNNNADPHKSTRETLKTIAASKETDKDPHASIRSNLKKLAPKKDNDSSSWKNTVGDAWSSLKKATNTAKEHMTTIPKN